MLSKNDLFDFRNEINDIDEKIVILLAKRRRLVLNIAQSKIQNNQPIRDIKREKNLLDKLTSLGKKNNLNTHYITRLFQLIIKESILTQEILLKKFKDNKNIKKIIFSFLGTEGSYSHIAASKYAQKNLQQCIWKKCENFYEVIQSVEDNESNYAILPIENNCSGPINEIFNILENINLFIIGEIKIPIKHCLLAIKEVKLDIIKKVYSHIQPFKQCSNFISQFPKWKIKYTNSTTDAIKKIIKYNKFTNAALGSEISEQMYGLKILSKNISNKINNTTRFIILSKNSDNTFSNIPIKTTIIFTTEVKTEEILKIIFILKQKKVIVKLITFLNSIKNKKIFYLDIEEHLSSNVVKKFLNKIQKITKSIKILGCYPSENKIIL